LFSPIGWRDRLRNDLSQVLRGTTAPAGDQPVALRALELMTIVLEDRRFFKHFGVDLRSVLREVSKALTLRRHGGFSTIDMQFVRTITGFRQHTIRRKVYEIVLALTLQAHCDKRTILRSYLACAYFGSGLIGAEAAARKVFGKDVDQLDLQEAAFIGAMLACPRPRNGSPKWQARVQRRAAYGLRVYFANGKRLMRRYNLAFQEDIRSHENAASAATRAASPLSIPA
jgi:membrane peptidoglycan carboxypeptidase